MKVLIKINKEKPFQLIVKKHPTENKNFLSENLKEIKNFSKVVYNVKPLELIQKCDLVLGMTSMFLLESLALKKPVGCIDFMNSFYGKVMDKNKINVIRNQNQLYKFIINNYPK